MGRQARATGTTVQPYGRQEWTLWARDMQSVPPLRREIMSILRRSTTPEGDLASAELVVAELLSNAVSHTQVRARVTLAWDGEYPVISVRDLGRREPRAHAAAGRASGQHSPATESPVALVPRPTLPDDPLAAGGRGLFIVDQLSRRLAVHTRSTGATVSATLDLRRMPAASTASTA